MEALALVAGAGMFVGLAYAVGRPLLGTAGPAPAAATAAAVDPIDERKEQVYAALRELDFDRQLGKVNAEDYAALRPQLEAEALALMDEAARSHEPAAGQENLEREVQAARQRLRQEAAGRCPGCGQPRPRGNGRCPRCGAPADRPG
jgi:rubrerythrin